MKLSDYKQQEKEAIRDRANGFCEVCGKRLNNNQGDFAHILGNTKSNLKNYGVDLIWSRYNGKYTCLNAMGHSCNARADIGKSKTAKIAEHVKNVLKKMEVNNGFKRYNN